MSLFEIRNITTTFTFKGRFGRFVAEFAAGFAEEVT
jgi:hypothetical protein